MEPIRIGVIGAGAFASRRHLPALKSDTRVTLMAACRRDPNALTRVADHFEIPQRFTDWQEMLRSAGLDGVLITTPHDQHAFQAEMALRQGLHVLLEKPMALTVAEARRLSMLATSHACCLVVAFNPPYWEHIHLIRGAIAAGQIGKLESVSIHWNGSTEAVFGKAPLPKDTPGLVPPTMFRSDTTINGGGNLMDGGGHLLSELLWVTGRRPIEVVALLDHAPNDSRASVIVRMEDGVHATISMISNSQFPERRVWSTYEGSEGTLEVKGLPYKVVWNGHAGSTRIMDHFPVVESPVQNWIDCIQTGALPLGSPEHGILVTQLLIAAYESAKNGGAIIL